MWKFIKFFVLGPISLVTFTWNAIQFPERLTFIIEFLPTPITKDWVRLFLGIIAAIYLIWLAFSFFKLRASKSGSLAFFPPAKAYNLVWDPPTDLQIITNPAGDADPTLPSRLPVFRLKNLSSNVIRNINIEWHIDQKILNKKIVELKKFEKFKLSLSNETYTLTHDTPRQRNGVTYTYSTQEQFSYEYLAPQIDNSSYMNIDIPHRIYALLEIIFVSELPDDPPFSEITKKLNVKISFEEDGKNYKDSYVVTARARSTKPWGNGIVTIPINGLMRPPPEIMSEVTFLISKKH